MRYFTREDISKHLRFSVFSRRSELAGICPYCCGTSRFCFAAKDWNQYSTNDTFAYHKCTECGLIFINPIPKDITKFYLHEQYDIPASGGGFEVRANSQSWKLDILKPYVSSGKLLEVGPATGEFANCARESGFSPTLIEQDPECCEFLRNTLKHHVIQSDDPTGSLPSGEIYDSICVWQVIEHIPQFWTFLETSARQIRTGGALIITTPNPLSFQARLLGRYWPHADVPRHLYLIDPQWFAQRCQSWNLRTAVVSTRDIGSIGLNYYGWFLWVRNWAGRFLSAAQVDKCAARLTRLFSRIETQEGRGCSYVIVMIKE